MRLQEVTAPEPSIELLQLSSTVDEDVLKHILKARNMLLTFNGYTYEELLKEVNLTLEHVGSYRTVCYIPNTKIVCAAFADFGSKTAFSQMTPQEATRDNLFLRYALVSVKKPFGLDIKEISRAEFSEAIKHDYIDMTLI